MAMKETRGRFAAALIVLEATLSVCALGGAVYFFVRPDDAMPSDILARTPFATWIWPGLLLALLIAVPSGVVAAAALVGRPWAHIGHPIVGLLLMGWIVVQVATIGFIAGLQPLMFAWGITIALLGAANFRQWQRNAHRPIADGPLKPRVRS
jgi:hypothetical protein